MTEYGQAKERQQEVSGKSAGSKWEDRGKDEAELSTQARGAGAAWTAQAPDSLPMPQIPDRTASILEHGAQPGGGFDNTGAFARAIEAVSQAGGGRVTVPPGLWLTGPIELQSRVELRVEAGAVVLFTPDCDAYPPIETEYEGGPRLRAQSPISGRDLQDVAITGGGVFDGSGAAWRPVKRDKCTERQWRELVASGGVVDAAGRIWWPSEEALRGAELAAREEAGEPVPPEAYRGTKQFLRPVMVSLIGCRRVLLSGPTFQNSPAWNLHLLLCEDVTIDGVDVRNPWHAQNGDGLDLESCRRVLVRRSTFDVGDDAICLKSGRDEAGRRRGRPSEQIRIEDCIVYHGHGGFVVGSEMSGGVRDVHVSGCAFMGTDIGLRFKSRRGRGGTVERIHIEEIRMVDIATDAISFDLFYGGEAPDERSEARPAQPRPVDEGTPAFRDIRMQGISCVGARRALFMHGLPEMPLERLHFESVRIRAQTGVWCSNARDIVMKDVEIEADEGPLIECSAAEGLVMNGRAIA